MRLFLEPTSAARRGASGWSMPSQFLVALPQDLFDHLRADDFFA
jgi:hypothetical protein